MPDSNIVHKLKNTQQYQYRKIVNRLLEQRKLVRISQEKLAQEIGIDTKLLGQWERMEVVPSTYNLLCWCEAIGVYLIVCYDDDEF